jgi:hypothetical protein
MAYSAAIIHAIKDVHAQTSKLLERLCEHAALRLSDRCG